MSDYIGFQLIWATVGSTETLLAVRKPSEGLSNVLTLETAGLSGGSFADITRKIEHACKISADGFADWINRYICADLDQCPDLRKTQYGYPDEDQYDDFQIIRWVKCSKTVSTVFADVLGDDPKKVKQSRAAEVIDKLAQLAHSMERASEGYAGLKRATVYDTDKVFEILTEAIELLQDAYEERR